MPLHRKYTEGSKGLESSPLSYDQFTAIRKRFRPNIRTHRKQRKKTGWNHLLCGVCEGLKRKLRHSKSGSPEAKKADAELNDHYDNEEAARRTYYKTRRKVCIL